MRKIIPWIPFFGGVYCQFNASKYFDNVKIQTYNFIYHLLMILLALILVG